MKLYERLKQDHNLQKDMAARLSGVSSNLPKRRELFLRFKVEMEAHAKAESQTLYRLLAQHPKGDGSVSRRIADQKQITARLTELSDMRMSSPAWANKFAQLKAQLERKIRWEEAELSQFQNTHLSEATAEKLCRTFDIYKKQVTD